VARNAGSSELSDGGFSKARPWPGPPARRGGRGKKEGKRGRKDRRHSLRFGLKKGAHAARRYQPAGEKKKGRRGKRRSPACIHQRVAREGFACAGEGEREGEKKKEDPREVLHEDSSPSPASCRTSGLGVITPFERREEKKGRERRGARAASSDSFSISVRRPRDGEPLMLSDPRFERGRRKRKKKKKRDNATHGVSCHGRDPQSRTATRPLPKEKGEEGKKERKGLNVVHSRGVFRDRIVSL